MAGVQVGSVLNVRRPFHDYAVEEGYLVLKTGDRVIVEYVGQGADEQGWLFGLEPGSKHHGWFPDWVSRPLEPPRPPAAPTPVVPLQQKEQPQAWLPPPPPEEPEFSPEPIPPKPWRPPPPPEEDTPGRGGSELPPPKPGRPPPPPDAGRVDAGYPQRLPGISPEALPLPGFGEDRPPAAGAVAALSARHWEAVSRGWDAGSNLPMANLGNQLRSLVLSHRVVIVDAATGSGKSTMVPLCLAQQCLEIGRDCRIIVTQPRRLAAKGLAARVADQTGTPVGDIIGYRVGGSDKKDHRALVVYVTVGHLLEALVHNARHLEGYSHIVLDEVHERFVEADFLMALLRLMLSRPETISQRIVVMSATLQRALGIFFRPALLPAPAGAEPGAITLPGSTPFEVHDFNLEDVRGRWPAACIGDEAKFIQSFSEILPSRTKNSSSREQRRRSDQLTKICKDLAPLAARLLCELYSEGTCVALVFLPGLDQMREVEGQLALEVQRRSHKLGYVSPEVFLMHSALDEELYKEALQPTPPGAWRVVLATNIAESSLTVPGVGAILDFGLHRVNVYDDDAKMSMLVTAWCSRASLKQRRGRTGRTNPGVYISFMSTDLMAELSDFDESGVERSPLLRVALEAAYLAEVLSSPPKVRAGLPVVTRSDGRTNPKVVLFWDGTRGGWRVSQGGTEDEVSYCFAEEDLSPVQLNVRDVLNMLPSPPREDRARSAVVDLQELGALCLAGDRPTALGAACLKLPVDVPLARLVVLGWAIGCGADTAVLAAALSLSPSCDVLRTPFNPKSCLTPEDLRLLRRVTDERRRTDGGLLSEPMSVYTLCSEWLNAGGGNLGRLPDTVPWKKELHQRLWTQFTAKVVDLIQSLLRLMPESAPCAQQAQELRQLLRVARDGSRHRSNINQFLKVSPEKHDRLTALMTWALAPLGFVAVGQTPALYGGGGNYAIFKKVVKEKMVAESDQERRAAESSALWWPKLQNQQKAAMQIEKTAQCLPFPWLEEREKDELFVGITRNRFEVTGDSPQMPNDAQFLYRICGPFNGKESDIITTAGAKILIRPPQHPCTYNWYMPKRDGQGMMEVRVNWKSQAETLLHVPRPGDRDQRCRPKRVLVASGGEYHSVGGVRRVMMRGVSLLPDKDGGRSAILWLLAAGLPREAEMISLVAPGPSLAPGDFEVRALRMWQRTLCLPETAPLRASDLRAVNAFRRSFLELQRRKPHRLAGFWQVAGQPEQRHVECLDEVCLESLGGPTSEAEDSGAASERDLKEREELLSVSGGSGVPLLMRGVAGGSRWVAAAGAGGTPAGHESCWCEEQPDGNLLWSNGSLWARPNSQFERPALEALASSTVFDFADAATSLLAVTGEAAKPEPASPWPARLVVLCPECPYPKPSFLDPFDLAAVEAKLAPFVAQLTDADRIQDDSFDDEFFCRDDDDDDDGAVDPRLEAVNQEYMLNLAEDVNFSPHLAKKLTLMESAFALPPTAVCVECEQENKQFSKSQLARPMDQRRCEECVAKSQEKVYKPVETSLMHVANAAFGHTQALDHVYAAAAAGVQQVALCSVCKAVLTKTNCTTSQRQKAPSKRKCTTCVNAGSAAAS
eukprot:TRINITY_DN61027_c0_g1_i1.p1 TRINITY_DN61027_c0_g1~~TRINITY_DN61027_c0_g1_i1.p1  ORF type:complete len:1595 (-),score=329.26 TRINITY_DN61027_c0_g1_i1:55-4839(-)